MNQKKKKLYKRIFKKSPEELEQYMQFKRRGSRIENKKGKGSYQRNFKHKNQDFWNYLVPSTRGLSHQPFTLKSSVQIRLGSPCGIAAYCERGWICKLNYHRRNQISRLVSLQPSWRRVICGFVICNRNSNKENESKLTQANEQTNCGVEKWLSHHPHKVETVGSTPTHRKEHKMLPHTFTMVCSVFTNGGTKNFGCVWIISQSKTLLYRNMNN